jgi:drug/metabolite transporter (DMT)-like permease
VNDNTGLFLVVVAQMFFSLMTVSVKQINDVNQSISVLQVIVVRMLITYVCSMAYLLGNRMDDPWLGPKGVRLLLISRGLAGFIDLSGGYFSLFYLSLPDAVVLTFLSPLCTAAAGAVLLKEKIYFSQALASVVSLVGVVLIARPPILFGNGSMSLVMSHSTRSEGAAAERMLAVGAALVGVLGITGGMIIIRTIGKRAHPMHVLASYSMHCWLCAVFAMIVLKIPFIVPSRLNEFVLLLLVGIFGFAGQCFFTMGVQRETATRASMTYYIQIVFAMIFERIFFHSSPSWLSIFGSILIVSSALYNMLCIEKASSIPSINLGAGDNEQLEV